MKNFFTGLAAAALMATSLTSCDPKPTGPGSLSLEFEHVFGSTNAPFALNTWYTHPMTGDSLNFSMFKYYVSNVVLTAEDGSTWTAPESYYLIDASTPASTMLTLENVPANHYTGISFMLGVDSARNVSGAQTGALDPANGMFWSWNTGYIFVKAEGASPNSSTGGFEYHLGGFKGDKNAIQNLDFSFGNNHAVVEDGANPTVHMMFNTGFLWCFLPGCADEPMIHMPGAAAVARMHALGTGMTFDHIHN